ncbi:MAG: DNA repair protein RadC [Bacillota bacterium]|nr:DNA repair protein RadC [Bacillota bacterium]
MIQDLPISERPREKILEYGVSSLSNAELIAVLISSGSKSDSAISLALKILSLEEDNIGQFSHYEAEEFMQIKGVGTAKACKIVAALELGRRIAAQPKTSRLFISNSNSLADLFMQDMCHRTKEFVQIAMLDVQQKLIGRAVISIGGISEAAAHPREVFAPAIRKGAVAIVVAHNHPSGECKASSKDISCTKQLAESGKILGIRLLDHIIIGDNCYISLAENYQELFNV